MKGLQSNPLLGAGFTYSGQVVDRFGNTLVEFEDHNLIPTAALTYLANLIMGLGTVTAPWYVGVFTGNYVPASTTKASDLVANAGESVAYSQATRPVWNAKHDGSGLITNVDSRAEFTFTSDASLYGGFLVSEPAKGSASGLLLSIARFEKPYEVPSGSTFRLKVELSLVP